MSTQRRREEYLSIFKEKDPKERQRRALSLAVSISGHLCSPESNPVPVPISCHGLKFSVAPYLLVGIDYNACDIVLPWDSKEGRVACVVYLAKDGAVFVNIGSARECKVRTQDGKTHALNADSPYVVIKDTSERAVLWFAQDLSEVIMNYPVCVVCEQRPRCVHLACGHFATCGICHAHLSACVLCRSPFGVEVVRMGVHAAKSFVK